MMQITKKVKEILSYYESENPGVRSNLARMMMQGKLAGTGKLVILPVDQGFEHGPERSFAANPGAYNPHYHFQLAIDAELSAFAAPLGMLADGAANFAGSIPLILKLNSSNSLYNGKPNQAVTASVKDALRLGCVAVGFTIYPGSDCSFEMMEEIRELAQEAKSYGLAVVIWSYPRGGNLSKQGETAIDVTSYACHIAALLGANIIKVKPPSEYIEQTEAKKIYEQHDLASKASSGLKERIEIVKKAAFDGRRLVVFSGGGSKNADDLYQEIQSIYDGGGDGSIIGRNSFQRPRQEALAMLAKITDIYLGK